MHAFLFWFQLPRSTKYSIDYFKRFAVTNYITAYGNVIDLNCIKIFYLLKFEDDAYWFINLTYLCSIISIIECKMSLCKSSCLFLKLEIKLSSMAFGTFSENKLP